MRNDITELYIACTKYVINDANNRTEYPGPSESKLVQFRQRLVTFKMSVNILKETAFTYALIF